MKRSGRGTYSHCPIPDLYAWLKAWGSACTGSECEGLLPFSNSSIRIVVPAVLISTLIGALNGYVIAKWRFVGEFLFGALLFGCFIPFQVILLPMARLLATLGANTRDRSVLVHVIYGIAFTTLFFRNFYVSVPTELVKSGSTRWGQFLPILGTYFCLYPTDLHQTVIWQFTQIWNDFLFGVVYSGQGTQPITVALNNLVNTSVGGKEYNVDMAAALIAALPTLVVYVLAGKYFVRGLTAGAVKG